MDVDGSNASITKISDFSMVVNFLFAIFLLVFNCGPFVFSENREFTKRIENLRVKHVPEEKKDEVKSMYRNAKSS